VVCEKRASRKGKSSKCRIKVSVVVVPSCFIVRVGVVRLVMMTF